MTPRDRNAYERQQARLRWLIRELGVCVETGDRSGARRRQDELDALKAHRAAHGIADVHMGDLCRDDWLGGAYDDDTT